LFCSFPSPISPLFSSSLRLLLWLSYNTPYTKERRVNARSISRETFSLLATLSSQSAPLSLSLSLSLLRPLAHSVSLSLPSQVFLVLLFWISRIVLTSPLGPKLFFIRRLNRRLSRFTPWQLILSTLTGLYALRHGDVLLGLQAPEPLARLYSRDYYR